MPRSRISKAPTGQIKILKKILFEISLRGMPLNRQQKQKTLEDLKEKIERQKSIVFLNISGIKVKDLSGLRREMKENDCELRVAKKTLVEKALKEQRVKVEIKKLEGEIALGFGFEDEILPFKICYEFSKTVESLKILGGIIGLDIIDKEKALFLANLENKEELLAKLVGSISAPISGFLNVLQANLRGFVFVLSAIKSIEAERRG